VLDRMQARLEGMPKAMRIRRATVEHVFGTLKSWMGSTHFQMRGLEKTQNVYAGWRCRCFCQLEMSGQGSSGRPKGQRGASRAAAPRVRS